MSQWEKARTCCILGDWSLANELINCPGWKKHDQKASLCLWSFHYAHSYTTGGIIVKFVPQFITKNHSPPHLFSMLTLNNMFLFAVEGTEGALVVRWSSSRGGDSETSAWGRGEDQTAGAGHPQVSIYKTLHLLETDWSEYCFICKWKGQIWRTFAQVVHFSSVKGTVLNLLSISFCSCSHF